jgi:Nif-specific regulatory protein
MNYHWPGNVRELENTIERSVLLSVDGVIHSHHLPPSLQSAESSNTEVSGSLQESLDNLEREMLMDALKSTKGNMAKAARLLDITERVMGLRVNKHGIDPAHYRTGS